MLPSLGSAHRLRGGAVRWGILGGRQRCRGRGGFRGFPTGAASQVWGGQEPLGVRRWWSVFLGSTLGLTNSYVWPQIGPTSSPSCSIRASPADPLAHKGAGPWRSWNRWRSGRSTVLRAAPMLIPFWSRPRRIPLMRLSTVCCVPHAFPDTVLSKPTRHSSASPKAVGAYVAFLGQPPDRPHHDCRCQQKGDTQR